MSKKTLTLAVFLLSPLTLSAELKYNYKPAINNLNLYKPDELKELLKDLEAVESFECNSEGCKVVLKPVLTKIKFKGFSPFAVYRLQKYLGLRNYYRYSERRLSSVSQTVAFFLKNNGYLDVSVKTELFIDKKGYATLTVYGKEGEVYFLGGFKISKNCLKREDFYRKLGIPLGKPFNYFDLYKALELLKETCSKKYFESFVYFKEPFEVKREKLYRFFWKNFLIKPSYALDFISNYADILITNPVKGIKFLLKGVNTVYPEIVVEAKKFPLKVEIEGLSKKESESLEKKVFEFFKNYSIFATVRLQNYLINLYKNKGYFDVKVNIYKNFENIKIQIEKGKRYKVEIYLKPKVRGFKLERLKYYDKSKVDKIVKELKKFLIKHGYTFGSIKISKEIDKKCKLIKVFINIRDLKKIKLLKIYQFSVSDKDLKEDLIRLTQSVEDWELIYNPEKVEELKRKTLSLLNSYGCVKPKAVLKVSKTKIIWKAYCGGIRRLERTAYWIEGRLNKKELEYLVPNFEGKRYRKELFDIIQSRFDRSELFNSFSVDRVDIGNKTIPFVKAIERKPFGLEGWFGYTSDEGFATSLNLKVYDIFRTGEVIRAGFTLSQRRTLYTLSYFDNYFFSKNRFAGFEIFKRYEDHRDYDITYRGLSLSYGYHFGFYTDLTLNLLGWNYDLDSESGGNYEKLTLSVETNRPTYRGITKNGLLFAKLSFSLPFSGKRFYKTTIEVGISKLFESFYLSAKLSGGYISGDAPIFEKFYLGGSKNLKGYSYESVAPSGGGDIYWYSGVELGTPIKKPLYLFGGFDAGNAVKRGENPFGEIKKDIFLGAGGITAIGPIRFVVASPLEGKISISNLKYLFLVGFSF